MQSRLTGYMAILAAGVVTAQALGGEVTARIADVTHLKGQRINRLVGIGLVTGLSGTGDGDDYATTMRALAEGLKNLAAPVISLEELKDTKNTALVFVEVWVPDQGVREGDRVDAQVTSFGAAKSLAGGRLMPCPLVHYDTRIQTVFAYASGPIEVTSEDDLRSGVVRGGAVMEEDLLLGFLASGRELPFTNAWIEPDEQYVTLVLDDTHAGWALAHEIAITIDSELSLAADVDHVALAADPRNVLVLVPRGQNVASWIRDIETMALLVPDAEARVTINRHTGTIVVSGDATISPVIVSQKGLTVTILPPGPNERPGGTAVAGPQMFVAIDPKGVGGAKVADLLEALNRLSVPIEDRIAILTEVHRLGKLHAKLLYEGQ